MLELVLSYSVAAHGHSSEVKPSHFTYSSSAQLTDPRYVCIYFQEWCTHAFTHVLPSLMFQHWIIHAMQPDTVLHIVSQWARLHGNWSPSYINGNHRLSSWCQKGHGWLHHPYCMLGTYMYTMYIIVNARLQLAAFVSTSTLNLPSQ